MTEEVTEETTQESGSLLSGAEQPAIERPEWVLDKYANTENPVEEQAKAYVELQKKLGGFTGAPEEYSFQMPEGVEGEIDTELPAYNQFLELAKEANMSNETAQGLFNIFVGYQQQMDEMFATDLNAQKEMLGPNADQRIGQIAGYLNSNLDAKYIPAFESMTTTADQIEALEALIAKTRNSPVANNETAAPQGFTHADFMEAVGSEKYKTDASYRAAIRKKAAHLFPGGE